MELNDIKEAQIATRFGDQDWWYLEGYKDILLRRPNWDHFKSIPADVIDAYKMGRLDAEGDMALYVRKPPRIPPPKPKDANNA